MLEVIQEIIFEITGIETLTPDTDFVKDLQLNSFDIVNIISAFERRFKIRVQTHDLWQLHTVRDVMNYMEQRNIGI
ncbi:MAG TPA: phosphopantetheine-binding protein [Bacillota bacterium]|nr:phosphopantetheine-binding protein [Bacillota bacterium]